MTFTPSRKTVAIVFPTLLIVALTWVLMHLSDAPRLFTSKPQEKAKRAAIAIRGHDKLPFFYFGTKLLTAPYLEKNYDRLYYFQHENTAGQCRKTIRQIILEATTAYEVVDLFILAHSNNYYHILSTIPKEQRARIRLVYNSGCDDAYQGERWLDLGIKAYVGHEDGVSISPIFFTYFIRRWVDEMPLEQAVAEANVQTARLLQRVDLSQFPDARGKQYQTSEYIAFTMGRLFGNLTINITQIA